MSSMSRDVTHSFGPRADRSAGSFPIEWLEGAGSAGRRMWMKEGYINCENAIRPGSVIVRT